VALDHFLMRMNNPYLKSFVLLMLIACQSSLALTQENDTPRLKTIVTPGGYDIPSLNRLVLTSRTLHMRTEDGAEVYRAVLRMKTKGAKILFEDTSTYHFNAVDGTLNIVPSPIMADELVRYDVGGRPFAYTVLGTGVALGPQMRHGRRVTYLGCIVGFAFFDEDGDGVFETLNLRAGPLTSNKGFHVPEWVKKPVK
jgi:hypothetical protein